MKSFIKAWVDGEKSIPLNTSFSEAKTAKPRIASKRISDEQGFESFLRIYKISAFIISTVLLVVLLLVAVNMPAFGDPSSPTNNIVVERYLSSAEHETGAENVIAGLILNYRGFDTFGESCVLFLAVCCVMLLLWGYRDKNAKGSGREMKRDPILAGVCKLLFPCVLLFGVCILFNGHISPGGGFSGGSVLGAALILFAVAFGAERVQSFFTSTVFNIVRICGLMVYATMFFVYIYQGANGIESELARYIVLVIDIAVGLVVMSTMYGFYSFYTRGEL